MKRLRKIVVLGLLLLPLLGILLWLSAPKAQQSTPPRLSIVALTNLLAGKRNAARSKKTKNEHPFFLFCHAHLGAAKQEKGDRFLGHLPRVAVAALLYPGLL